MILGRERRLGGATAATPSNSTSPSQAINRAPNTFKRLTNLHLWLGRAVLIYIEPAQLPSKQIALEKLERVHGELRGRFTGARVSRRVRRRSSSSIMVTCAAHMLRI